MAEETTITLTYEEHHELYKILILHKDSGDDTLDDIVRDILRKLRNAQV